MRHADSIVAATAVLAAVSTAPAVIAGNSIEIATGLVLPVGLEADSSGQLWVAEMGADPTDPAAPGVGRVSMLAGNLDGGFTQVPLLENIPVAFNTFGEPSGTHHISFASDGSMLVATGGPYIPGQLPLGSITRLDPTFSSLAAGPHAIDGAATIENIPIFPYVRQDAGYADSNVYSAAEIGGDLWIVDAGANAVIRRDAAGGFSVLADIPNKVNPKGTTPPTSQSVPTRIISDGRGGAYLAELTGFPFVDGSADIYRLAADGTLTTVASGLKTLVDLTLAEDGSLLVCSAGDFDPTTQQPTPGTGKVLRVRQDGSFETFIDGLWLPTGVEIVDEDVFVAQFVLGTITQYVGAAPQRCPGDLDGDGTVTGADVGLLVAFWGGCP